MGETFQTLERDQFNLSDDQSIKRTSWLNFDIKNNKGTYWFFGGFHFRFLINCSCHYCCFVVTFFFNGQVVGRI